MKRKTMFMVQGIVCLVAVLVIGVLSVFSPINVTVYPTEEDFIYLGKVVAGCENAEELSEWLVETAASSQQPAKELTEDDKEYLAKVAQAEAAEAAEKAELETKILAYEAAIELEKTLRFSSSTEKEHAELLKTISEMEKELDKAFEGKKVAESVVLKRQAAVDGQFYKGVEISVPLLEALVNIKGFINLDKLITANKDLDKLIASSINGLDASEEEKKTELTKYLADKKNYEGINTDAVKVSMFLTGIYNKDLEDEKDLFYSNKYRIMYRTIYEENAVLDQTGSNGLIAISGLVGVLVYIISVIWLVINAIISLFKALVCIKNPDKLYTGAIKGFKTTGTLVLIGILSATCMGSASLNAIGIIMLVLVFCVYLLNGFAVRTEKRSKEENLWYNITQGAALLCSVAALVAILLLIAGNPYDTYNASLLASLQKGKDIINAQKIASYGIGIFNLFAIFACGLVMAISLRKMACIGGTKKLDIEILGRLTVLAYIIEGVLIIATLVLMIMGVSLGSAAIVALIMFVVMLGLQIATKILCKKFVTNLRETEIADLQNAAYYDEKVSTVQPQQVVTEGTEN